MSKQFMGWVGIVICGLASAGSGQDFHTAENVSSIELGFPQDNWDHLLDSLMSDGQGERPGPG